MATNWTFVSGASAVNHLTTATVACSPTPNAGDLLVVSWASVRTTTFTAAGITDNGSGGWSPIGAFQIAGGFTAIQSWWKVASAQDHNLGAGFVVTVAGTGGTGTFNQFIECDVFRLPQGYAVVGLDLSQSVVGGSSVTTFSWSPTSGSSYPTFTDALAWTSWCSSLFSVNGGVTGSNTYTGTSAAANLAVCVTTNDTILLNQFVGGVTASATAGTNVWKNTWTTARGPLSTGATFVYTTDTGLTVPKYAVRVTLTDPYDTPDWVDITRWVKSGTVNRGRQHELQRAVAGTCALTISNQDGRFSTFNTASPYINLMTSADSYFQDVTIGDTTPGTWAPVLGSASLNTVASLGYDGYAAMSLRSTGTTAMAAITATGTNGYAVAAGRIYGFQAQFKSAVTARSCLVGVNWYNSGGTIIGSTVSGASVTDNTSTYTKATLTATAPAGAAFAAAVANVSSTVSNETHYVTRVMISNADQQGNVVTAWAPGGRGLVPARPVTVTATSNLVTYPVYYGYVDSWVPSYTGPVLSDQVIKCTDGLNLLALSYITSSYYQTQVIADGATSYWALNDSVNATFAIDAVNSHSLFPSSGTGAAQFGQASLLETDTGTSLQMSGASGGQLLESVFQNYVATSGFTVEAVVQTSTLASLGTGFDFTPFFLISNASSDTIFLGGTPAGVLLYSDFSGEFPSSFNINDGHPHHIALTVTTGGVYHVYADGAQVLTGTGTSVSGSNWFIELTAPPGGESFLIAGLALTQGVLSASKIAVHSALSKTGFVQQQSGQRITSILNVLGVPSSLQSIATGISAVQAPQSTLATTPALSYIQTVETTEQGFFYVDESGNFVFRDRHYIITNAAATTPNGTFANDTNATHYKYLEGIVPGNDALDLWNDAPVSAIANASIGVTGAIQDAPNTDSERWYGRRTIQGYSSMLQITDIEALSLSQWLVAHYGLPIPRVREMKLDSSVASPSSIPQMLGRKLWDCITVSWQPSDGTASSFVQTSLIENIQHDFGPDLWTTTWGLSVAETQVYLILNDAVRGTLAATGATTGNRLGY